LVKRPLLPCGTCVSPYDHEPAHVHVFGDGEAKINLIGSGDAPELVWAIGMKRNEVRRAMAVVREQRAKFIARWRSIHG
jgi:hypothetical protein